MSTKALLRIGISAVLLVVIVLSVQVFSSKSAPGLNTGTAMTEEKLAGSDWIERHPSNYYVGSDWIERHPSVIHPANYYVGSDWIERHPSPTHPANYYVGSDWIERHPSNYYTGSDWIERHPSQPTR